MDAPTGPPNRPGTHPIDRPDSEPEVEQQTETLDVGPSHARRRPLLRVVVIATSAVLLVGAMIWTFWPRSVAPLTLDELEGVYAGMVRSDGVNDASVLNRASVPPRDVEVAPASCLPLFHTTVANQFPAEALDGVGTYWIAERATTSLFTMRFPDAAAAAREYAHVDRALVDCLDTDVVLTDRRPRTVRVSRIDVTPDSGVAAQSAYVYGAASSPEFAVHLLQFENTVSWQFRYDSSEGAYEPLPAQQLMSSLMSQTRAVLELRT